MIKLTLQDKSPIWVNPNYIASIVPSEKGSLIGICNDVSPTFVFETPETIIQKISVCHK